MSLQGRGQSAFVSKLARITDENGDKKSEEAGKEVVDATDDDLSRTTGARSCIGLS